MVLAKSSSSILLVVLTVNRVQQKVTRLLSTFFCSSRCAYFLVCSHSSSTVVQKVEEENLSRLAFVKLLLTFSKCPPSASRGQYHGLRPSRGCSSSRVSAQVSVIPPFLCRAPCTGRPLSKSCRHHRSCGVWHHSS